jgi:hypothetical protein
MKKILLCCLFIIIQSSNSFAQQWASVGFGFNRAVNSMVVYNGDLYVSCNYDINTQSLQVMKYNGTTWSNAGNSGFTGSTYGVQYPPAIYALNVYNNQLWVGGNYMTVEGMSSRCLASFNGSSWSATSGFGTGDILALGSDATGSSAGLIVGGMFSPGYIAGYYGTFVQFGNGLSGGPIRAVTNFNGTVYGDKYKFVGGVWTGLTGGPQNDVYTYAQINNQLYAGCEWSGLYKLNGTTWAPFESTNSFTNPLNGWPIVEAVAEYHGEIYAAGNFRQANGTTVNYIARWDGSSWQSLGSGLDYTVHTMAVYNDELYVGGEFTNAGGVSVAYIAKWNMCSATISAAGATTVCSGNTITLNALTSGSVYQWKNNNVNIPGATAQTYIASVSGNYTCSVTNTCGTVVSNSITVTVLGVPAAAVTSTSTYLCNGGTMTMNATSGNNLTYQWKLNNSPISGATAQAYSANLAGNYSCVVSNACSASTSNVITLTNLSTPVATISSSGQSVLCSTDSIILTAGPANAGFYQWMDGNAYISGAVSSSYRPYSTGFYWCKVGNSCGSDSTPIINVQIYYPYQPFISAASSTNICQGNTVLLSVPYQLNTNYQWKRNGVDITGAITDTYVTGTAGSYTCVINNICGFFSSSNAVNVTITSVTIATIAANGPVTFCPGGSVLLALQQFFSSYQWKLNGTNINGANSLSYSATSAGAYTCEVTNGCGTTVSNSINVTISNTAPVATISAIGSPNICSGNSIQLSANTSSGISYQWKLNGNIISGANSSVYFANTAGSYTCEQTNSCGTGVSNAVIVTVSSPPLATITAAGSTSICTGNTVLLSANTGTGISYQWKLNGSSISGATLATYSATAAGNYTCTETNSCGSNTSAPIAVSVTAFPVAIITSSTTQICPFGNVILSANSSPGYSFQWKLNNTNIIGATASSYPANTTGSYLCSVTNLCGTSLSNTITLFSGTNPSTPGNISGAVKICRNIPTTYSVAPVANATSYNWSVPGGVTITSGQGTNSIIVIAGITFSGGIITVTASNGCGTSGIRTKSVSLKNNCSTQAQTVFTDITNADANFIATIYPNPASTSFNLKISVKSKAEMKLVVYDISGRIAEEKMVLPESSEISFGHELHTGIYVVKLYSETEVILVTRVMKNEK